MGLRLWVGGLQPGPIYHLPPPEMWELFQVYRRALTVPLPGLQASGNRTAQSPWDKAFTCPSHRAGPQTALAGEVWPSVVL